MASNCSSELVTETRRGPQDVLFIAKGRGSTPLPPPRDSDISHLGTFTCWALGLLNLLDLFSMAPTCLFTWAGSSDLRSACPKSLCVPLSFGGGGYGYAGPEDKAGTAAGDWMGTAGAAHSNIRILVQDLEGARCQAGKNRVASTTGHSESAAGDPSGEVPPGLGWFFVT